MSEPRGCAWCNERVKQGEPCVNNPSGQVGGAYRYFHEWCYGLHEHHRAEAAEARLHRTTEALREATTALQLAAYTGVPMCNVCGRSSTQHSDVVAALANARAVLGRGLPKGRASEPPLD